MQPVHRHLSLRRHIVPPRRRSHLWWVLGSLVAAGVLLGVTVALWLNRSAPQPSYVELVAGTVEIAIQADAMILRSETVYRAPAAGHAQRLVEEGERVRVGSPVVHILSGTEHATAPAQPSVGVSQLALRRQIEQIDEEIYRLALAVNAARENGNWSAAQSYQEELDQLGGRQWELSRRLGGGEPPIVIPAPPPGGRLEAEVQAEAAGIVSFQVDGLEELLSLEAEREWTPSWFRSLAPVPIRTAEGDVAVGAPLFTLVDNMHIGLLALLPESALPAELPANGKVQLHFANWPGRTVSAQILSADREGGEVLLRLATQVFPGELTSLRRTRVTLLFGRYRGLVVPSTALDARDGQQGVWVQGQREPYFHPVRVLGGNAQEAALETDLQPGTRLLRFAPGQTR